MDCSRPSSAARACLGAAAFALVALGAAPVLAATDPAALERLEQLAGREPVQAQRDLNAWLATAGTLDETTRLRVEFVRVLIADAQYRADDVLRMAAALREALQRQGDARMLARLDHVVASAHYELGRFDEEWIDLQDELQQAERAKNADLVALAQVNRLRYFVHLGDYQSAAGAVASAQAAAQGEAALAELAFGQALLAKTIGDWEAALRANGDARVRFQQIGDRTGVADALAGEGEALVRLGRAAQAVEPLRRAAQSYRSFRDQDGAAIADSQLADAQIQLGDLGHALEASARAVQTLEKLDEPWQLAEARVARAEVLLRLRRAGEALGLLGQARAVVLDKGDLAAQARYYDVAAQTLAALGRNREAYEQMRLARDTAQRRTEQLVARQLAAQRGRLESERLARENSLLRDEAASSQNALQAAVRAERLQRIALALGATIVVGALFAVGRQRSLTQRFAQLAQTDGLTGVLNRRNFLETGQRIMNRSVMDGAPCALLMLDLDRFKEINDRHGHVAGDAALRAVSQALRQCLRPHDLIGRYGGEEFALILPGADATEAAEIGERLRHAVGALKPDWAAGAAPITVSGGIAVARGGTADLNELLLRADRALYRAKDAGRNRMELAEAA